MRTTKHVVTETTDNGVSVQLNLIRRKGWLDLNTTVIDGDTRHITDYRDIPAAAAGYAMLSSNYCPDKAGDRAARKTFATRWLLRSIVRTQPFAAAKYVYGLGAAGCLMTYWVFVHSAVSFLAAGLLGVATALSSKIVLSILQRERQDILLAMEDCIDAAAVVEPNVVTIAAR